MSQALLGRCEFIRTFSQHERGLTKASTGAAQASFVLVHRKWEILSEFFLGDEIRRLVVVLGKLAHMANAMAQQGKSIPFFLALLLPPLAIVSGFAQSAKKDAQAMNPDIEYGTPNSNAPPELSQFAFIIGKWRCDVRVKGEEGTWQTYQATWVGRYILDGYVIADEYRMTNQSGELIVEGMNFRSYSAEKKTWVMRWLDATRSFWVELGPEKLGGVRVTPKTISFNLIDRFAPDALSRVTFSNISESHFTWSEEKSLDQGKTWTEFVIIEAHRTK